MAETLRVCMTSAKIWPGDPGVTYQWDQDGWREDHPCTYDEAKDWWLFASNLGAVGGRVRHAGAGQVS